MLNVIKDMIKQKKAFQEAADIIMEDDELDDSIVLTDNDKDNFSSPIEDDSDDDNKSSEDKKDDDDGVDETKEDPNDPEANVDHTAEELPDDMSKYADTEDIMNISIGDDLPDAAGKQTGEPAVAGTDDILSIEIDPTTSTVKDILPTPPASAVDAVASDNILDMKIDSGFGDEEPETKEKDSAIDEPIGDVGEESTQLDQHKDLVANAIKKKIEDQKKKGIGPLTLDWFDQYINDGEKEKKKCVEEQADAILDMLGVKSVKEATNQSLENLLGMELTEAISIGGKSDDNDSKPADSTAPDEGQSPDDTQSVAGDNAVTNAVKDKVGEANSDDTDDSADTNDSTSDTGDDAQSLSGSGINSDDIPANKEELFKKLSNITKNIEDIKTEVLKNQE